ncbi:MAG: efflux transporter outer membrane subunit [Proteobacteria bacterium]|nr:efflux transporter outer membrane subunit [Pseudomonadota bacterium]
MLKLPDVFPDASTPPVGVKAADQPGTPENLLSVRENWRMFFTDPHLKNLIEGALQNNQELHILEQEIAIAGNEVMARRGEYLPKVSAGADYGADKVGKYTSQGTSDEGFGLPKVLHNREAGFYASWEVDIWKKLRNAAQSAQYRYLSSMEGRNFAVTNLVAEIANTYYELMSLDRQMDIVKRYVSTLQQAQQVVQYQKEAAKTTSLAVTRFEAEVLKNQSRLYTLQQQITVTENKLNALVGRFPQPIERSSKEFTQLNPQPIKSGIPVELLENRPDIKQSVLDMKAAELDVSVAKARFYPSLSLDAGAGFQGFNSKYFTHTPESLFYNVAANLTAPVINRMAIEADYLSANSKQLQSIYNYQQTIINAYVEVVNQLNAIRNSEKIFSLKTSQVKALTKSIDISNTLFKAARIDYLEQLLTQRDALEAQIDLMETKQKQLSAYVNLYKALGGGWRNTDDKADAKTDDKADSEKQ